MNSSSRTALLAFGALTRRLAGLKGLDRLTRLVHSPDRPAGSGIEGILPYGRRSLFHFDTANYVEWCVFFRGRLSSTVSTLIPLLLRPGMVAVDIGANNGTESILMAEEVGASGRVIAVEPSAGARLRLSRNLTLNRCTQVEMVDQCVGAQAGATAYLIVSTTNNPSASTRVGLRPEQTATTDTEDAGTLTTVDELLSRCGCRRVDLIKIDTDGSEVDVLTGAVGTLKQFHPAVIFEFDAGWYRAQGKTWEQAYCLMSELGYRLYGIRPTRRFVDLEPLTLEPPSATDVLAVWSPSGQA